MPKVPYTENIISKANNPLPFPNYLNTLSLLTDSSLPTVRNFFNANKSFSEALVITIISIIEEGIAYQLANHKSNTYDKNSKSYTNNTNYYCCKGVPIKTNSSPLKRRSNSFSYSTIYRKNFNEKDEEVDIQNDVIVKDNENTIKKNDNNKSLLRNRDRSYSSPKISIKSNSNSPYPNGLSGSQLKYSFTRGQDNASIELPIQNKNDNTTTTSDKHGNDSLDSLNSSDTLKININQNESISDDHNKFMEPKKGRNKISVFILLKNLLNILDLFKSLNNPSSVASNSHQKPSKPFDSVESLTDQEKWKEFNRVYNETMYNLKAEEYYKSKSKIFKYSSGINSVQSCFFDTEDNTDDIDNSFYNSLSFLDEKIRENSKNKITDTLSKIKKDTLTFAEIKECGEYMRRVGIYQFFIQCPVNHFLRVIASKLFSCGEKKYSPILRFLFVTCVISPIQVSINILCLALSNKKTPLEIKKCFSNNFTHILKLSLIYVPFSTQYLARTFLPRHLWVPFFNLSSFILGTYIKLIMKKKDNKNLLNF